MTRMYGSNYPSFARLALMLRGTGGVNPGYDGGWGGSPNGGYQRPFDRPAASMNDWAATQNIRAPGGGGRLPVTRVQEILPGISIPWGDLFPGDVTAPEYFPAPSQVRPFPLTPDNVEPIPLDLPNSLRDESRPGKKPRPSKRECDEHWADAGRICDEQKKKLQEIAGHRYVDFDDRQCLMGLVSEACGGNPVQWGPGRGGISA